MFKEIIEIILRNNKSKNIEVNSSVNFKLTSDMENNILNELLRDNVKLSVIPDAFRLLLSSNEKTKLQAAEILKYIIGNLNSSKLIKVENLFRERSSYDWQYNWSNKDPQELLNPLMLIEEKITILGLSSFHPNGYFREKAILALSGMETGQEIPYILIRLNDWVREVRSTSKKVLSRYITPKYAMDFVNNLPLVLRLRECSRDEHTQIIDKIISIISSKEGSENLIKGLQSTDPKVRLACYKVLLETKVIDTRIIMSHLIKDNDPYNRLYVFRRIQHELRSEEFTDILQLLINDKFAQIRVLALESLYAYIPEDTLEILEKSLFDKNKSVRDTSRYLLSKHKKYDFAAIYREAIYNDESLYSSICGLGETGDVQDSEIVIKFIHSNSIKIVKASITALARLNIQGYKDKLILLLNDNRVGISKLAKKLVQKEINNSDADTLYEIYKQAKYDHMKINAISLLCLLSKWNSIRYIIEFCSDENKTISTLGQSELESWRLAYNNSFTAPTKYQIEEIRKLLEYFGEAIKDSDKRFIEFRIRDFER
ncbi:HEAT repeat domain-containing protein [Clostridium sp. YIM B02505]|uniref:HEAT repeat domain-containing protein n=1 Tax=Clostridium yunnanense TaxID=2800325 RepID=A0ABS1EMX2_9CLOT|nr:HEAT repeat domain-containing protein [Clostridium yunnanense]MBK1810714.1 HEAT repeat domain-containing protein [Clostridium yunnanense]